MSEIKLLSCPFCGNEAELKSDYHDYMGLRYWVFCKNCGSRQTHSCHKDEVIRAWNTRKPMDRIVEQLEEKTQFLKDCTKYGNKDAEQQEKSYSTMMMYEVADLVNDLIDIIRAGGKGVGEC